MNPHDAQTSRTQVQGNSGAADEVADIREAIKRSLDRSQDVKPEEVAAVTSVPSATPVHVASKTEEPAHVDSAPHSETSPTSAALAAIDFIEERFVNLSYDFKFTSTPDFASSNSSFSHNTASSALLDTPTNAPIRAYEQSLASLLTDLDAIESFGDEDVRHARKEMVVRVEHALAALESEKEGAWRRFSGGAAAAETSLITSPVDVKEAEAEGYVIPDVTQVVAAQSSSDTSEASDAISAGAAVDEVPNPVEAPTVAESNTGTSASSEEPAKLDAVINATSSGADIDEPRH